MLYMFKIIDGRLAVYRASGMTSAEKALGERGGWTFYMTTDRTARADAESMAA